MRICPADAERAHAGAPWPVVGRLPRSQRGGNPKR
jgi:hypothetical protein